MNPYKYRNSESNIKPRLVEFLQDGVFLRFDIKKVQREDSEMFEYKEFWFELNAQNIEEVVKGILNGSVYGGTGNGFTKFTGPTTAEKTFTLPDASSTLLYSGGALGTPASGTATNVTGLPLTTGITGVLPVANGGTNISSYTIGDIIYASGATTLVRLADVAVGQVLMSGGVIVKPAYTGSPSVSGSITAGTTVKATTMVGNVVQQTTTLVGEAITLALTSNVITLTGDALGNTVATFTGAIVGIYTVIFVDALITLTDTDAHTGNTFDLVGTATNLTSADDLVLQMVYDGTSFYEVSRSSN